MAFIRKALLRISISLILWVTTMYCDEPSGDKPWEKDDAVPLDTIPTYYLLTVYPNMDTGEYNGSAVINITVTVEKRYLWINRYAIDISKTDVTSSSMHEIPIKQTFLYKHFFVIELETSVTPGDYQLRFLFNGSVHKDAQPNGQIFFIFVDSDNIERRILYSSVFYPFFHSALLKTAIDITVVVAYPTKNYSTISNTQPEKIIPNSPTKGTTTVKFAKSPKIQPGAAIFMVHNFEGLPTLYSKQNVALTMYGRSDILRSLQRSLETAVAILNYYCDFHNITFLLKKIDIIAMPNGPNMSYIDAFIYPGLAVFSERTSIYAAGESDCSNEYYVVSTVAHEIAHTIYLELVTPLWNTDQMITEGVASYFEDKATKFIYPSWDVNALLIINKFYWTMSDEAELTTLPVGAFPPSNADDTISEDSLYAKGAAVVRMLEFVMGENNIRQGFRDYVRRFAMKAALATDLWNAMQPYAPLGVNVTRMMLSWTVQRGYPLLTVQRNNNILTINQSRFLLDRNATYNQSESPFLYQWDVPVTLVASNGFYIIKPLWLRLDEGPLKFELPPGTTWVKVNTPQCNYMRVLYSLYDWQMLANVLQHNMRALDPIDRGDLIDSAFALAESEYISYSVALDMIVYMGREDSLFPWYALLEIHMPNIARMLSFTHGYLYFQEYFSSKLINFLDNNIWTFSSYDTPDMRLKQSLIILHACQFEIPKCTRRAKHIFDQWLHCRRKPHADARETVYNTGVSLSGVEEWNAVWKIYTNESNSEEKRRLRNALCNSRDPWIITQLFDIVINKELLDFIESCAVSPVANMATWQYVRGHWEQLYKTFGYGLIYALEEITKSYSTDFQLNEVEAFFAEIPEDSIGNDERQKILTKIRKNIAFREKHGYEVTKWFKNAVQ